MDEQLAAGMSEGQIAEFVQNDEVHASKTIGHPPLSAMTRFPFEGGQIEGVEEAAMRAAADAGTRRFYDGRLISIRSILNK